MLLQRRGLRLMDSREARRSRGGWAHYVPDSKLESSEDRLTMLHINLRGYLSHIAEVTAVLRGPNDKPSIVALNETFSTKAILNVYLQGYLYWQVAIENDDGWRSFGISI